MSGRCLSQNVHSMFVFFFVYFVVFFSDQQRIGRLLKKINNVTLNFLNERGHMAGQN